MRISDWSSDVCSSDLRRFHFDGHPIAEGIGPLATTEQQCSGACEKTQHSPPRHHAATADAQAQRSPCQWNPTCSALLIAGGSPLRHKARLLARPSTIGRASCREIVCQYV